MIRVDLEPYIIRVKERASKEGFSDFSPMKADYDEEDPVNIRIVLRAKKEQDNRLYDLDIVVSGVTGEILEFHPNIVPNV
jgi:hypothetical protein